MASNIIDFVSKRKEKVEKKRRSFERILFREFFNVETTVSLDDEFHHVSVDLIDVSREGCLFRVPEREAPGFLKVGSNLTLKLYFSEQNYIHVSVAIKRTAKFVEKDGSCLREYGCEFDKSMGSFRAMEALVDFLHKLAEYSCTDYGHRNIHLA